MKGDEESWHHLLVVAEPDEHNPKLLVSDFKKLKKKKKAEKESTTIRSIAFYLIDIYKTFKMLTQVTCRILYTPVRHYSLV